VNYTRIYFSIIEKRKNTIFYGYSENHHIVPRSLEGSNSSDNVVRLTAREHFLCHWLLTKMYNIGSIEWIKMVKAFRMMFLESID
jgi:hypothetical protein